jgi:hypothetical protein
MTRYIPNPRLFILFSTLLLPSFGQDINATLRGTVHDSSGAVISGAVVKITSTERGVSRSVVTNGSGDYVAAQLPAESYAISAVAPGFQAQTHKDFILQVGQEARLDFTLQVGQATEQIEVTGSASLIQSEDHSIGDVVDEKKVKELPLNGRNAFSLALLAPNVFGSLGSSTYYVAGNPSVNNNYLLDGIQNNDRTTGSPTHKPSVDGIQEFRVLTGTYQAEYGRQSGGQIIMTTKSGTNSLHGTAYEFFRNNHLDSRGFFSQTTLPPFTRNQYGTSLGGPIQKSKTFFFITYEGLGSKQASITKTTVPTVLERSGDFSESSTPITINGTKTFQIPQALISTVSQAFLQYWPLPTTGGLTNNYISTAVSTQQTNQFSGRVDRAISAKNNLFFSYQFYNSNSFNAGTIPGFGTTVPARTQAVSLTDDHIFTPALVNELRIGYNRWYALNLQQDNALGDVIQKLGLPQGGPNAFAPTDSQTGGVPQVSVTGFATIGAGQNYPQSREDNTFNYVDALTWTHGAHTFKFGADIEHFYKHSYFVTSARGGFTFNGQFTGNAFADFLTGGIRTSANGLGDPNQNPYTTASGLYAQDDWKVSPNLTLNIGLRYELFQPQKERVNKLSTFDVNQGTLLDGQGNAYSVDSVTGALVTVGTANLGDTIYNEPNKNFAPRFGFAYRVGRDNRTVVRGGYGIFYDQLVVGNGLYQNFGLGPPYVLVKNYTNTTTNAPATWSNPFPAGVSAGSVSPYGVNRNLPTPYRQQWSFGVQRELIKNLLLDVSYLGSNGEHLPLRYNINQPTPAAGAIQARRPYPAWSTVTWLDDVGTSSYNALTVRLERRYANGLTFLSSFAYSKALDLGTTASSGTSPQDPRNLRAEWGPATFDARLRYVGSVVYELPFGKGRRWLRSSPGWLDAVAGGWEATGIITLQRGSPFNVTTSKDISNTGGSNRPFVVGNPHLSNPSILEWFNTAAFSNVVPGGGYSYGNAGRDILVGPGLQNFDLGLFKNYRLTERFGIQFRAEAFNALNHANFSNPTADANSSSFGQISSTSTSNRDIQFGLKVLF